MQYSSHISNPSNLIAILEPYYIFMKKISFSFSFQKLLHHYVFMVIQIKLAVVVTELMAQIMVIVYVL